MHQALNAINKSAIICIHADKNTCTWYVYMSLYKHIIIKCISVHIVQYS